MGGDADIPCLKGKLQLYSAGETCGCLAIEKPPLVGVWEDLAFFKKRFLQEERWCGQLIAFCCLVSSMLQLLLRDINGMRSLSFHTRHMRLTCLLGPYCSYSWISHT